MNRFDQLDQTDADTTVSEEIIETRFGESGDDRDDAASTTPSTARAIEVLARHPDDDIADAIEDLERHTDDTIAEINAIPASSPVFSDDLHRLEQSIVTKYQRSKLKSERSKLRSS